MSSPWRMVVRATTVAAVAGAFAFALVFLFLSLLKSTMPKGATGAAGRYGAALLPCQ